MLTKKDSIKSMCITAICIALCVVLPMAFHAIGAGPVFLPMHIPVLLCGLLCGWFYGAACGLIGPLLSSLLTGMPPTTALISMVPELIVYGLISGLLIRVFKTGKLYGDLYLALIVAMLAGRLVGGIAKALFLFSGGQPIVMKALVMSYFVTSFPGIVIQLVLIPTLVVLLMKARLVPKRYGSEAAHEN